MQNNRNTFFQQNGINQLDRETIQKVIHFNTKFRNNYFLTPSSDFKYSFPLAINNVLSVRLRSIDIPNTWYTFSERIGNNKFIIETEIGRAKKKSIFEIIIPDGNYNAVQFQNYINNTYLYLSGVNNELNYLKLTINENNLKSKFEFFKKPPTRFKYSLKFMMPGIKTIMYTMGWNMGFRMAQYLNLEENISSEGLFDGGGDRYIYVSLEDYNKSRNDNNIIFLDNTFIDKDIIGKMYLHDGKFNININDNDGSENLKKREFMGPVDIKTIHIKLLDEYGNIVYLNNMDWSFALEFEILYRKYQKNYTR
tara:strand:- start:23 stop:949 length:927 start_codon:yes stop_codon:yes gene_type:complete